MELKDGVIKVDVCKMDNHYAKQPDVMTYDEWLDAKYRHGEECFDLTYKEYVKIWKMYEGIRVNKNRKKLGLKEL